MSRTRKTIITLLAVVNLMVLLGQIWPAGAPPFARTVNTLFLAVNLFFLLFWAGRGK